MSDLERVRIAALALLLGLPALPAMAQEVGKASAVNPAATANLRTITIGSSITHKERIKTATAGSVQILFVDKTSMTIGPNSDLTIDEYVYDPNAGTGKLAATLGKGALRFVGGQISHSGDAEIKTASAVIGIRGGVALISPQNIYAGYGSSTVSSGGGTVTLGAGEFTQVGGGGPPSPPGPPPPNFVAGFIQQFQSAGGQTGGAPRGAASPANVARAESRATGTNGGAVAGQLTPPVINQMPQLTSTPGNNLTQTIQTTTQQSAVQSTDVARPTITLSGFIGGLMQTVLVNNYNYSYYASISTGTVTDGTATVTLDAGAGRVQAKFAGGVEPGPNASYLPSVFEYHYDSQGDYADYNNFVALPVDRRRWPAADHHQRTAGYQRDRRDGRHLACSGRAVGVAIRCGQCHRLRLRLHPLGLLDEPEHTKPVPGQCCGLLGCGASDHGRRNASDRAGDLCRSRGRGRSESEQLLFRRRQFQQHGELRQPNRAGDRHRSRQHQLCRAGAIRSGPAQFLRLARRQCRFAEHGAEWQLLPRRSPARSAKWGGACRSPAPIILVAESSPRR